MLVGRGEIESGRLPARPAGAGGPLGVGGTAGRGAPGREVPRRTALRRVASGPLGPIQHTACSADVSRGPGLAAAPEAAVPPWGAAVRRAGSSPEGLWRSPCGWRRAISGSLLLGRAPPAVSRPEKVTSRGSDSVLRASGILPPLRLGRSLINHRRSLVNLLATSYFKYFTECTLVKDALSDQP